LYEVSGWFGGLTQPPFSIPKILRRKNRIMETQGTETKVEGAEPIQPEVQPTGKTYTEEDFQRAVSKGLESIQKQLDLRVAEAKRFKAEAEQYKGEQESLSEDIKSLQQEIDSITQAIEDPEVKSGILSKKALNEEKRNLAKLKAEAEKKLYDAEMLAWSARMAQKAQALHKETGIDVSELEDCHSEEEMEVKALRYSINKAKEEKTPKEEEKSPKFASPGGGGGGGRNLDEMSARELIKLGVQQKKK